jgi:hypothetical protein
MDNFFSGHNVFNQSEPFDKVVIARSEATCLRAEALRRASVAILEDCFIPMGGIRNDTMQTSLY